MQVEEVKLQKINKLLVDYKADVKDVTDKFEYKPYEKESYIKRAEELKHRVFKRDELADILTYMNQKWKAPSSVINNINRLRSKDSMVVIGGQQAGLLTGPIYTIHKIVTLIQVAKKQEKELNAPVIPVFWIAGEDHDFDEINHIYIEEKQRLKKHTINQYQFEKKSVSDIKLDKEAANVWVEKAFKELEETVFTRKILMKTKEAIHRAETFVDFFAELVMELFGDLGLVLLDSGNHDLRGLESDYFKKMILNQPNISGGVFEEIQKNIRQGYPAILEVNKTDAHLFYHHHNERVLLTRDEAGNWKGKQEEVNFTEKEMLKIADHNPELLSNNVVTRPIMQEMLFPSLAFVGGPGEIAYWSVLKPAFNALEYKMPIVLPRMSFTLIDQKAKKQIESLSLIPSDAVNYGLAMERGNWLNAQHNPPIDSLAEEVKKAVGRAHLPLRESARSISNDLGDLAEKNLVYLLEDVDFLRDRLMKTIKSRHADKLAIFNQLELLLFPFSGLQERTWNILPWLNQYGKDFLMELVNEDFNLESDHFLIYL